MTIYVNSFQAVSVSAQVDFFEIVAPATGVVVIHRCLITQSSDVGDAAEEGLLILLDRGNTTSGSGGTAITQAAGMAMEQAGPAFTGTVEYCNTTKATAGTVTNLHAEVWNVRTAWDFLPTPELRPVLSPSQRAVFELATTPADALTVSGTLVFEWLGG